MKKYHITRNRPPVIILIALFALCLAAIPPNISGLRPSILTIYAYGRDGSRSMGSGWMISDHQVVTCYHVIEDTERTEVMTDEHQMVPVQRIEVADKDGDIAILDIPPQPNMTPLPLADRPPKIGERVYVVATPHGLSSSLGAVAVSSSPQTEGINQVHTPITVGAVTAVKENHGVTMVQFTAPITHGCSGGAVVNDQGEVVAVVQSMEGDGVYYGVDVSRVRANLNSPVPQPRPNVSNQPDPHLQSEGIFERANGNRPQQQSRPQARPNTLPDPRVETRPRPGAHSAPSTRPRPQTPRPQPNQEDNGTIYESK